MNSPRKLAIAAGVLFILATLTGAVLATPLTPDLAGADVLTRFAGQNNKTAAGVLLWIVSAFAGCGIAVALYPVLKERNAALALGSVVFRSIEAGFYLVGVACLLALMTLGRQYPTAGAAERALLQSAGDLLVSLHHHSGLVAVFAFCAGGMMYYLVLFQGRFVPPWLSGFGVAAMLSMTAACVLAVYSGNRITSYIPLAAPIALQEILLGLWLIVKGFNS